MHHNRRFPIAAAIGLCSLIGMASSASARDYYVSTSGSDTNAGTSTSKPWKTITKVNSTTLQAGDRVFFQGGATFAGNLYIGPGEGGTAAKPVVITSYGTGRATISAGTGTAIYVYDTAGIAIQSLNAVGVGRSKGNYTDGISFYSDIDTPGSKLDTIKVDSVDVSGFGQNGLVLGGYAYDYVNYVGIKTGFKNVSLTNIVAHDNGDAGITTYGTFDSTITGYAHQNVYVGCCTAYNNVGIPNKGNNSGNGIVLSDVDGGVIEASLAYNNGAQNNHPGGGPVGIWAWECNNVALQYNESYGNKSLTNDGGGFDLDGGCKNCVMQFNYSHDNVGNGYLVYQFYGARPLQNNTVQFNLSVNDGRTNGGGLAVGGGAVNTLFLGNQVVIGPRTTVQQEGPFASWVIDDGMVNTNTTFSLNIFATTGGVPLVYVPQPSLQPGLKYLLNVYGALGPFSILWGNTNYTSERAWHLATGQDF